MMVAAIMKITLLHAYVFPTIGKCLRAIYSKLYDDQIFYQNDYNSGNLVMNKRDQIALEKLIKITTKIPIINPRTKTKMEVTTEFILHLHSTYIYN